MAQKSKIDDSFTAALIKVVARSGLDEANPVAQLAAALHCYMFVVDEVGDLAGEDALPWQRGRGYGPYIWLWSYEGKEWLEELWKVSPGESHESPEYAKLRGKIIVANLRDRLRLVELLGEFYSHKQTPTPIDVRLIVSDLSCASSLLKCQGGDVMALPENKGLRKKWLVRAHNEMRYFAKFLFEKLDQEGCPDC